MAPPKKPEGKGEEKPILECRKLLPDQNKWSHEKKAELAKDRNSGSFQAFFDAVVGPLNKLAKQLGIADVTFLLALSSWESGWLNAENTWLSNPFGMTMAGRDNLGFDSIQQAADYWGCVFGPHVKGAKTMDDFVAGLKRAKYNPNESYYAMKKWNGQIKSVEKRIGDYGYEKATEDGVTILRKKK